VVRARTPKVWWKVTEHPQPLPDPTTCRHCCRPFFPEIKLHAHFQIMADELKPGQKFPTPTPGFGDRVFYETLYRQRPESEMAQEW